MGYEVYVIIFSAILLGGLFFYEAIRVQRQNGVVMESKIVFIITFIFSIIQFLTLERFDTNPVYWYGGLGIFLALLLLARVYFGGKNITIYNTSLVAVVDAVEKQLTDMNVRYEEKDGLQADQTIFYLPEDDGVLIKIDGGINGADSKDIRLSLRKWWRSPRVEEFQLNILENFREKRDNHVFWKQIMSNILLGIGTLTFLLWLASNIANKM